MKARTHSLPHGRHLARALLIIGGLATALFSARLQASRVKDLTQVEGGRDNQLVGYG